MTERTVEDDRPQIKPFAAWLQEQRGGVLHAELSEALAEVVAAALEHDKPGTVALKITIRPDADGAVKVSDDWSVNKPRETARPSLFFADDLGNLSRRNPRQPELPLRDASARRANDDSGANAAEAT